MDNLKQRFSVSVDRELYDKINTYQHEKRMKSQTQAIAEILKFGIEAILEDENQQLNSRPLEHQPSTVIPDQLARIIEIYNEMNTEGQEQLSDYAEYLGGTIKYKKDSSVSRQATG